MLDLSTYLFNGGNLLFQNITIFKAVWIFKEYKIDSRISNYLVTKTKNLASSSTTSSRLLVDATASSLVDALFCKDFWTACKKVWDVKIVNLIALTKQQVP